MKPNEFINKEKSESTKDYTQIDQKVKTPIREGFMVAYDNESAKEHFLDYLYDHTGAGHEVNDTRNNIIRYAKNDMRNQEAVIRAAEVAGIEGKIAQDAYNAIDFQFDDDSIVDETLSPARASRMRTATQAARQVDTIPSNAFMKRLPPKGNTPASSARSIGEDNEGVDTIEMDVALFIRSLEWAKEDALDDIALHKFTENVVARNGILTMDDYDSLIPSGSSIKEGQADEIDNPVYTDLYKKIKHIFVETGVEGSWKSLWRLSKGSRKKAIGIIKKYAPTWFADADQGTFEAAFDNVVSELFNDGLEVEWLVENRVIEDASAGGTSSGAIAAGPAQNLFAKTTKGKRSNYKNKSPGKDAIIRRSTIGQGIYEATLSKDNTKINEFIAEEVSSEDIAMVKDAWMKVMPNSAVYAKNVMGTTFFNFMLSKDRTEVSNGILENDPLSYSARLGDRKFEELSGSLAVKPTEPHLAFSREKFRKMTIKNPTFEQLVKRFTDIRNFIMSNADKLKDVKFDIKEK